MLNTEDTKINKSPSCTRKPTVRFGGRNKTNHFGGRNRSFKTAPMKQWFQQKMGFGSLRDGYRYTSLPAADFKKSHWAAYNSRV